LGLFELLVFGVVGSLLIYWLYVKTDLPLVKNKFTLFGLILLLILGLSFGATLFIDNFPPARRTFRRLERQIENFPYRRNRFNRDLPPPPEFFENHSQRIF
jgi:hypothetical protein